MPETITLYDADGNPVEVEKPEPANIRQMREHIASLEEKAKQADELAKENTALKQQSALSGAGLALDEDRLTALNAVHKGEWTPEAVKETAVRLGWAEAPAGQTSTAEQEALARMQAARTGGTTSPPDPDAEIDAKLAAAKSPAELMEIYRQSGRAVST